MWYQAAREFICGTYFTIQEGKSLWFDGTRAHYSGKWYEGVFALNGAVRHGWLVPLSWGGFVPAKPVLGQAKSTWEWLKNPAL